MCDKIFWNNLYNFILENELYDESVYNYNYMKYKCFSPIHYTFENIRISKAKEKFNLQYLYMSPYVSWQVDLLNLDNVYPLGIRQKISKSIIKTSFATAQISSRFYFIQFFQKTIQNVLSCLLIGWLYTFLGWITLSKFCIKC